MMMQKYFIGVDVAKETLDFSLVYEGKVISHASIQNELKTIKNLLKQWSKENQFKYSETLVCMEHTGIYSYHLVQFLQQTECMICMEPAYTIKHSNGLQRGKNDKIDSARIAIFAWKNKELLKEWKAPKSIVKRLKQLMSLRKNIIKSKLSLELYTNELRGFSDKNSVKELKQSCRKSIAALQKDKEAIEHKMVSLLQTDDEVHRIYKILISVEGIGSITAILFIVTTNAFTSFTEGKKYACYAGVVPFDYSSGKSIRGRNKVSHLANKEVKTALHMGAIALCCGKGELGQFYQRKVAEGKNKMAVLNAVRNKIVLRAFSCVKNDRLYEKGRIVG
jgi:transposase